MDQGMEGFEQELQALKDSYADQVPQKLAEIDELWRTLVDDGWDEETFKTLHRMVHSMAGSAQVFGFTTMGKRARELETFLKAVSNSGEPLSEAQYAELPVLVEAVRASAQFPDGLLTP